MQECVDIAVALELPLVDIHRAGDVDRKDELQVDGNVLGRYCERAGATDVVAANKVTHQNMRQLIARPFQEVPQQSNSYIDHRLSMKAQMREDGYVGPRTAPLALI